MYNSMSESISRTEVQRRRAKYNSSEKAKASMRDYYKRTKPIRQKKQREWREAKKAKYELYERFFETYKEQHPDFFVS